MQSIKKHADICLKYIDSLIADSIAGNVKPQKVIMGSFINQAQKVGKSPDNAIIAETTGDMHDRSRAGTDEEK